MKRAEWDEFWDYGCDEGRCFEDASDTGTNLLEKINKLWIKETVIYKSNVRDNFTFAKTVESID